MGAGNEAKELWNTTNGMIVYCAGMRRSASTLQYNIVRRILEISGVGESVHKGNNINPSEHLFSLLREDKNRIYVYKNHFVRKDILSRDDTVVFSTYRDLRDVVTSMINFQKTTDFAIAFEQLGRLVPRDTHFSLLKNKSYRRKYEDFYNDIYAEVESISNFLHVDIGDNQILKIANELNRSRIKNVSNQKISLLAPHHVNDGSVGQWKTALNETQIRIIENKYSNWLVANGYELQHQTRIKQNQK